MSEQRLELVYGADDLETAQSNDIWREMGQEPPKTPVIVVYEKHGHGLKRFCECGRDERALDRARLISAAPDLLAACESWETALKVVSDRLDVVCCAGGDVQQFMDSGSLCELLAACVVSRKAIAKARG
jgi:hypothetical protein